jgi:hypothetical protein
MRYTVDGVSWRNMFAQDASLAGVLTPAPFSSGRTVENAALPMFWGWGFVPAGTTLTAWEHSKAQATVDALLQGL